MSNYTGTVLDVREEEDGCFVVEVDSIGDVVSDQEPKIGDTFEIIIDDEPGIIFHK